MPRVAPEDTKFLTHVEYLCGRIHDFGDEIYEDLMEREHEEVKVKAQELIKELAELIQSLSDDV
jgi:hypothetical protein